jgi:hypothetical protein
MTEPSIQYRPPHKIEAGYGFENGARVPITASSRCHAPRSLGGHSLPMTVTPGRRFSRRNRARVIRKLGAGMIRAKPRLNQYGIDD